MPDIDRFHPRIGPESVALGGMAEHLGVEQDQLMVLGHGRDGSYLVRVSYPDKKVHGQVFSKESERYVILPTGALIKAETFLV